LTSEDGVVVVVAGGGVGASFLGEKTNLFLGEHVEPGVADFLGDDLAVGESRWPLATTTACFLGEARDSKSCLPLAVGCFLGDEYESNSRLRLT
jgi:hypothetical protein